MSVQLDDIMLEITRDDAPLCDEFGDPILDEAGNDIYLEQPGFVDVWPDVMSTRDAEFSYGIFGNHLTDRVAGIGTGSFRLNNSASNAAGLAGFYSPDHANFVGGFERETLVKLTLEKSGARKVKWRGVVKDIKVEPGSYAGRFVDVECDDYMVLLDDFADMNLQPIQTDATSDELYTAITNAMLRQFPTVDFSPNGNELTYGFDTANRQKATARNEINKIALSVMDYVFIQGDNYEGAKLTSQTYADRIANQTNSFTLADTAIRSLQISRTEKIDRSVAVTRPRSVGTANEILYTLNVPGAGKAQGIYPGDTYTFTADYRDPDQSASRIAAESLATQVASTDYKLGRGNGDDSEDLNGSATIVISAGATSAEVSITNNHAMFTMYINFFQLQGIAIRQFEAVETVVDVDNPIGDKELRMDLAYEDDRVAAQAIAELGKVIYQDGFTAIDGVTYLANRDATHLGYLMDVEPGMRGTVSETQSGINQSGFVNSVSLRFYGKEYCDVTYGIDRAQPVDGNFWLLEEVGMGELGDATYVFGV